MAQDNQRDPESALIGLYIWAEQALLAGLAGIVRTLGGVDPLMRSTTARLLVRRLALRVVARLGQETPAMLAALIAQQTAAGAPGAPPPPPGVPPRPPQGPMVPFFDPGMSHGDRAVRQIENDLASELADVRYRITRLDDDVYKAIAPEYAVDQVSGAGVTPQQAQARAWQDLMRRGVTGFTDKSGRDWPLSSYVEMAVRTAAGRAFNAARMEHVASNGGNLLFVSDDGHPCPLCLPWQNVVLAIVPDGVHPTVDEAIAAGLFHPNCKHHMAEYVEGHTHLGEPQEWTPEDQAAYEATQKQRALERAIRAAKRDLAYARTPEAEQAARADIRDAQARLRKFLADNAHLNLVRKSRREQIDLAYPTTR